MPQDLFDLSSFAEEFDVEAKAAQGRGGESELPQSFWESYSAMANSDGGYIYLGVEEKKGVFRVLGLKDVDKIKKTLWDSLNNRQIINRSLLREVDVETLGDNEKILSIRIPRAKRTERPIFVGRNPYGNTYRRNYTGDYKCDDITVNRMMAEATEESRDERILPNYQLDDINAESLAYYRGLFRTTKPSHPWLQFDDIKFLRSIGAWKKDRENGDDGLTAAGLLMFGDLPSILDAFPNYVVDYQEQPLDRSQLRWLDRLTTDGTWSGNLFDFYRRCYSKLTADLQVPFRMEKGRQRVDESHVHEALREALVNTLIHADFTGRSSLLVVKRPNMFGFRNPGNLRLPLRIVLNGGESDCRNRRLQKMFQLIGAAEQAGSGIPKILRAWQEKHWRLPLLNDENEREQTVLRLPTVSLLPPDAIEKLRELFGSSFDTLNDQERVAVVTAYVEGKVTNERLREIVDLHSKDCSNLFKGLVERHFLEADGVARWTSYHIANSVEDPTATFLVEVSPELKAYNPELTPDNPELTPEEKVELEGIATSIKQKKGNVSRDEMKSAILQLCQNNYRTPKLLGELLGRTPDNLRRSYLSEMIKLGDLLYQFPQQPNNPNQAYKSKSHNVIQSNLFDDVGEI